MIRKWLLGLISHICDMGAGGPGRRDLAGFQGHREIKDGGKIR